jgi:hypothetical protein
MPHRDLWAIPHFRYRQQHRRLPRGADVERASVALALEDLISTAEAAEMLKVSERQMRNLVSQFGGRRAGRAWVFDRALVGLEAGRRLAGKAAEDA